MGLSNSGVIGRTCAEILEVVIHLSHKIKVLSVSVTVIWDPCPFGNLLVFMGEPGDQVGIKTD